MADQKDTKKTEQAGASPGIQTQAQRGKVKVTMHIGKGK
jgi:hypothetical protein